MNNFTISPAGVSMIKTFEGVRVIAYADQGGIWTVGYGAAGPDIHQGVVWTMDHAVTRLTSDLHKFEAGVNSLVKSKINQHQFDSLVSFSFNLGLKSLERSTLLKLINDDPEDQKIAYEWQKWANVDGRPDVGLQRRRRQEAQYYFLKS